MTAPLNATEKQSIQTAIEMIQKAVTHDQRGTLATALSHYCRGLNLLLLVLHSPRCTDRLRDILRHKCRQYLDRARVLREAIRRRHAVRDGNVDVDVAEEEQQEEEEEEEGAVGGEMKGEEEKEAGEDSEELSACSKQESDHKTVGWKPRATLGDCEQEMNSEPRNENHDIEQTRKSGEHVLDQSNGKSALNSAEDEKATLNSNKSLKCPEGITEDRIPETITEILDRVVVRTDNESQPQTTWRWVEAQNVGVEEMEMSLKEILLLPVLFPQLFTAHMFHGRRRLLLYSHHEDSVLSLLQRFIRQCNTLTLLTVSAHSLLSMAVDGEDTKLIWKALWARARLAAPCAVCVTDVDVFRLGSTAENNDNYPFDVIRKMSVEFLMQLDGLPKTKELVLFVGITSQPWLVDKFLLRRLDVRRYLPPPSPEQRLAVVMSVLQGVRHTLSPGDLQRVVFQTAKFTRTGVEILFEEAQACIKGSVQEAKFFRAVNGHGQRETAPADDEDDQNGPEEEDSEDDNGERGLDGSDNHETVESNSGLQMETPSRRLRSDSERSVLKTKTSSCIHPDQKKYTPCDGSDSDAVSMTWQELEADQLLEPPMVFQDVLKALGNQQGQIDGTDWVKMTMFHEEYGQY